MNQPGAQGSIHQLGGPVGNDLVGIGVGGGPGTGLKYIQDEMVVQLSVDDLLSRLDYHLADFLVENLHLHESLRGSLLDQPQRADKGSGKPQVADRKVEHRPHGGGAVKGIGGDLHFTHGVALYSHVFGSHRGIVLIRKVAL